MCARRPTYICKFRLAMCARKGHSTIVLVSGEGGCIAARRDACLEASAVLRDVLGDMGDDRTCVPVTAVPTAPLTLAVQHFEQGHLDFDFIGSRTLAELIVSADFLDASGLVADVCDEIEQRLVNSLVDEIRGRFGIISDMTPEEQADVRRTHAWHLTDMGDRASGPRPSETPSREPIPENRGWHGSYESLSQTHATSEAALALVVSRAHHLPICLYRELAQCSRRLRDEIADRWQNIASSLGLFTGAVFDSAEAMGAQQHRSTRKWERFSARLHREWQQEFWRISEGVSARPWRAAASEYVLTGRGGSSLILARARSWSAFLDLPRSHQLLLRYSTIEPPPSSLSCDRSAPRETSVVVSELVYDPPHAEQIRSIAAERAVRAARFDELRELSEQQLVSLSESVRILFVSSAHDSTRTQIAEAALREVRLRAALSRVGCSLRRDSVLCERYIQCGVGDADEIAATMEEMDWLYRATDYDMRVAVEMDKHAQYLRRMDHHFGGQDSRHFKQLMREHRIDLSEHTKDEIAHAYAVSGKTSRGIPRAFAARVARFQV